MSPRKTAIFAAALWLGCASRGYGAPEKGAALRMAWAPLDHASGVYHAKDAAALQVDVENPGATPGVLKGTIAFGLRLPEDGFKTLSLTPVKGVTLAAGERAKVAVDVTFAGVGTYELRWIEGEGAGAGAEIPAALEGPSSLECIFAPRTAPGSGTVGDPRWLAMLPLEAARSPGMLHDLAIQMGVTRFLVDERFAFDEATGVSLPLGTGLKLRPEAMDELFAQAAAANVSLVLRITVPMEAGVGEDGAAREAVEGLHQYVAEAIRRGKGVITGMAIIPEKGAADRATYRAYYLAAYGAAKGMTTGDRHLLMLGAGTAEATRDLLLAEGLGLQEYVDAVAVTDTTAQVAEMGRVPGAGKLPVWVLPPVEKDPWSAVPPAVALAEGAAVAAVPPPGVDRGVAAHLFGGAAWYQTLGAEQGRGALPFVATFQGDRYAVAAVAGVGAGTALDAAAPGLAHARTIVSPVPDDGLPPYPQLEIADSSGSIRVVDAQGAPVDCRQGDTLYVPAADRPVYVLQSGTAEDLLGVMRSGLPHRLAVVEITAKGANDHGSVMLQLRNIAERPLAGTVRLLGAGEDAVAPLGEGKLGTLAAGALAEVTIPLAGEWPRQGMVVVEITTGGAAPVVQRTALRIR